MKPHEERRLEVERETGHPFHATKTDAVRSLFDANHATDLEHRRTPDISGFNTADEIADQLRHVAENDPAVDTLLRNLLNRAANRLDSMRESLRMEASDTLRSRAAWLEAERTVDSLFKREDFWAETVARIYTLCNQNNIEGIRGELFAARNMPYRIARSCLTEKHYDSRRSDL
jgi:hypothetical protein